MSPVLFAGQHVCELGTVPEKVTELADGSRWNKAGLDHPAHNEITDPFGILAVGLVALLRFCIFGMGKCNVTGFFKDVEDGNPVLAGRFHADEFAVILLKPFS